MTTAAWMDVPDRTPGEWAPFPWADSFSILLGPIWLLDYPGEDGEVLRLGLHVQEKHCNRLGICHGGALAMIVDTGMGLNANVASGVEAPTPTISLSIDFLKPARPGDWIETRTRVVELTRTMCFVDSRLVIGQETIVRSNAVFKRLKSAPKSL